MKIRLLLCCSLLGLAAALPAQTLLRFSEERIVQLYLLDTRRQMLCDLVDSKLPGKKYEEVTQLVGQIIL
jgi:hypothetical protein